VGGQAHVLRVSVWGVMVTLRVPGRSRKQRVDDKTLYCHFPQLIEAFCTRLRFLKKVSPRPSDTIWRSSRIIIHTYIRPSLLKGCKDARPNMNTFRNPQRLTHPSRQDQGALHPLASSFPCADRLLVPQNSYSLVIAFLSRGVPSGAIPFAASSRLCLISLARSNEHFSIAMILRTSSTPRSSRPVRFSPEPSPMFSSKSKLLLEMPAAAWSENEYEARGV